MDYPYGKFGYWFYRADKQTHTQTDADECYTLVTLVGVSNNSCSILC